MTIRQSVRSAHLLNDKVCLNALEGLVRLLLQHKDNITRQDARLTVASLTTQHYLGIVLVPLLNVHLKDLLLWKKSLQPMQRSSACRTGITDVKCMPLPL
jgi:ferric iron reductase protein FhuF